MKRIIIPALLLLVFWGRVTSYTSAQNETCYEWFAGLNNGDPDWFVVREGTLEAAMLRGDYVAGSGSGGSEGAKNFDASIIFDEITTLRSVEATVSWNQTRAQGGSSAVQVIIANTTGYEFFRENAPSNITSGTTTKTWTDPQPSANITTDQLDLWGVVRTQNSGDAGYANLTYLKICVETNQFLRPLTGADEADWNYYEHGDGKTVVAFSEAPGLFVYAGMGGIVTTVEENIHCGRLSVLIFDCAIAVPASARNSSGPDFYYSLRDLIVGGSGVNRVVIENGGISLEYYVAEASDFVEEGQEIEAGCYLGRTISMSGIDVTAIPPKIETNVEDTRGVTAVTLIINGGDAPLIDLLTLNPIPSNACNVDPDNRNCLGDSALESEEDWTSTPSSGVSWNDPGVTLGSMASIHTAFNLSAVREPTMIVAARTFAGQGTLKLVLGLTTATFTVTGGDSVEFIIAPDQHQPDMGLFYTIMVANDSQATMDIEYVCVANTKDGSGNPLPEQPPDPDDPNDPDDGFPDEEPPFYENCEVPAQPSTETLVSQIGWHWQNLESFFQCDLMRMLNRMYQIALRTYRLIGWSVRWTQSLIMMWVKWFHSDLIYWLDGHFANMANGRQTFIEINEGQEQCGNLFCLIDGVFGSIEGIFDDLADIIKTSISEVIAPITGALINLLNVTVDFVFSVLTALLRVGLLLISVVIGGVNQVRLLFAILIDAWNNSTPQSVPGMPYCDVDPQGNPICVLSWMLENTIFSGRGAIIPDILIGTWSIQLILWGIGELKRTIMEAGQAA